MGRSVRDSELLMKGNLGPFSPRRRLDVLVSWLRALCGCFQNGTGRKSGNEGTRYKSKRRESAFTLTPSLYLDKHIIHLTPIIPDPSLFPIRLLLPIFELRLPSVSAS